MSEKPEFVDACAKNGITFIGPRAETIRRLGDKVTSKRIAEDEAAFEAVTKQAALEERRQRLLEIQQKAKDAVPAKP